MNTHWQIYVNYESKHFLEFTLPNKQSIEGHQYVVLNGAKISFDLVWLGGYSEGYGWDVSNIVIE